MFWHCIGPFGHTDLVSPDSLERNHGSICIAHPRLQLEEETGPDHFTKNGLAKAQEWPENFEELMHACRGMQSPS